MWIDDPFWQRAARSVATALESGRICFAPAEFQGLGAACYPFAFAFRRPAPTGVLIFPKGDVDQFPLSWIDTLGQGAIIYADEVFVGIDCDKRTEGGSPWMAPDPQSNQHLPFLRERANDVLSGRPIRTNRIDETLSNWTGRGEYVIVVSAAMTGNAGDRLMTSGCLKFLQRIWGDREFIVSNGDLDRTTISGAAAIVLGPGGMLYDIDPSGPRIDLQNLANYFKFGHLASEYGSDFYVLGIGRQGSALHKESRRFVESSIRDARLISTRDKETAAYLAHFAEAPVLRAGDFSELLVEDVRLSAAGRSPSTMRRLVICGDFRQDQDFPAVMAQLVRSCPDLLVDLVVQANEDLNSLRIHERELKRIFADRFRVRDARSDHQAFIRDITAADCIVTSRFHAFMISLMAGISSLVFYEKGDKRDRIFPERDAPTWVTMAESLPNRWTHATERLVALCSAGQADIGRATEFDQAPFDRLAQWMRATAGIRS